MHNKKPSSLVSRWVVSILAVAMKLQLTDEELVVLRAVCQLRLP
jgi:hypothetical protein